MAKRLANKNARTLAHKIGIPRRPMYPLWMGFQKCVIKECACGSHFVPSHALRCPKGGYPIIRHNELHDLVANMMKKVGHDVEVEPNLQSLDKETLTSPYFHQR